MFVYGRYRRLLLSSLPWDPSLRPRLGKHKKPARLSRFFSHATHSIAKLPLQHTRTSADIESPREKNKILIRIPVIIIKLLERERGRERRRERERDCGIQATECDCLCVDLYIFNSWVFNTEHGTAHDKP